LEANNVAYYQQRGSVPPKRHIQHRDDHGNPLFEELMGEDGFVSDSSLLYHSGVPSALTGARTWHLPGQDTVANQPLLPRHLQLHELFKTPDISTTDAVTGRRLVLGNDDVRLSYVAAGTGSPLYRNALGDECVFVEAGTALVETVFGPLAARSGDYVIIPRATTHRWIPTGESDLRLYVIEANSHITPARRYLSKFGQLLEHAPYSERDLRTPGEPPQLSGADVEVYVKHRGAAPGGIAGTVHVSPHHPFDVAGWDGCLYPYTFNVEDFMPITGRIHQPPPAHQVFEGNNFVICNFVPRKVDYHPQSIPVPYYHSNVDSDEVMFYVSGEYEARRGSGIRAGSVSLHPGGHSHGPQREAYLSSVGKDYFDELAIMVDTFRPLGLGEAGRAADDHKYAWTWSGRGPKGNL
jgi:homogentisate 1,2-dioxygenase